MEALYIMYFVQFFSCEVLSQLARHFCKLILCSISGYSYSSMKKQCDCMLPKLRKPFPICVVVSQLENCYEQLVATVNIIELLLLHIYISLINPFGYLLMNNNRIFKVELASQLVLASTWTQLEHKATYIASWCNI